MSCLEPQSPIPINFNRMKNSTSKILHKKDFTKCSTEESHLEWQKGG